MEIIEHSVVEFADFPWHKFTLERSPWLNCGCLIIYDGDKTHRWKAPDQLMEMLREFRKAGTPNASAIKFFEAVSDAVDSHRNVITSDPSR